MRPNEILIPLKFYFIMIQIILIIVISYTKEANINSQLAVSKNDSTVTFSNQDKKLTNLITAAYVLNGVELLVLFSSITIFLNQITSFQIIFHFIADLCLCWFIWQTWISDKFWIIFVIGCIIPIALELIGVYTSLKRKLIKGQEFFY
jgi:hypothetical protein